MEEASSHLSLKYTAHQPIPLPTNDHLEWTETENLEEPNKNRQQDSMAIDIVTHGPMYDHSTTVAASQPRGELDSSLDETQRLKGEVAQESEHY